MEGGGTQAASLYEILFDLEVQICERFHLSPIQLRRERFSEFCLLVKRLKKQSEKEENNTEPTTKTNDGKNQRKFIPVTDYKKPTKKQGGDLNGR